MNQDSLCSNTPGVIRTTFRLLETGPFAAVRTDKDGGFVPVSKAATAEECLRIFSNSSMYRQVSLTSDFFQEVIAEYISLVRLFPPQCIKNETERQQYHNALVAFIHSSSDRYVCSKLRFTVKTHKPSGDVTWRGIHSSVGISFLGGMRLISHLLRPAILTLPHLLKDSAAAVKVLCELVIPSTTRFIRIDIRELFMTGSHEDFC